MTCASDTKIDTAPACPDCAVPVGHAHVAGCDVARCLHSGQQRLSCLGYRYAEMHDCGDQVWTGMWPGEAECHEFGWYSYFRPGAGWIACGPEHPGATSDLNRLHIDAHWSRATARWERGACEHRFRGHDVTDDDGQPLRLLQCIACGSLVDVQLLTLAGVAVPPYTMAD